MPLVVPPKPTTSKFAEINPAAQVLEEAPPPTVASPQKVATPPKPRGRPGRPGPASKKGKPGPASAQKRNNDLKGILEAQAPPEIRKLRSEAAPEARTRKSESYHAPVPVEALGPRSRRSLPAPNEKPATTEKPEPATTRGHKGAPSPASKKSAVKAEPEPTPTRQTRGQPVSTPAKPGAKKASGRGRSAEGVSSSRADGFKPRVAIRPVERQRADREFERSGVQVCKDRIG